MKQFRPEKKEKKARKIWFLTGTLLCIAFSVCIATLLLSSLPTHADEELSTTAAKVGVTVETESINATDWEGGSLILDYDSKVMPGRSVAILPGDRIRFQMKDGVYNENARVQYIIVSKFITDIGDSSPWRNYSSNTYLNLSQEGASGFIYFRVADRVYSNESKTYVTVNSKPAVFAYSTVTNSAYTIRDMGSFLMQDAGGATVTALDVGDKVFLTPEALALIPDAKVFYTRGNSSTMSLTLLSGIAGAGETLNQLKEQYRTEDASDILVTKEMAAAYGLPESDYCYVRLDGIWYRNDDDLFIYSETEGIQVDESARKDQNMFVLKLTIFESKKALGSPATIVFPYALRFVLNGVDVVPATTDTSDSENIARISIDQTISIQNANENSNYDCTILYTVNRNAPTYAVQRNTEGTEYEVVPTGQTRLYEGPFNLDDSIANYGANFYLTVMVVCFEKATGYQLAQNSMAQTFTYFIEDQSVVAAVQSTPSTSADAVSEIKAGDVIILHSTTPNVEIFYTTDGTEPLINADGTPGSSSTFIYSANQGVVVPDLDDTVFTITAVAYRAGLATSNISRLTFRFPSAVSAPYAVPTSGTVTENTQVILRTATEGAVIRYTVGYEGQVPADPTESSAVFTEDLPILIDKQTTVKAIAISEGIASSVNTFQYFVYGKLPVPVPSINNGSVVSKGTIVYLNAGNDATIYYTVDGSNPKEADNKGVYVGNTVVIDGDPGAVVTVKTYAMGSNASGSEMGAYNYTISNFEGGVFADKDTDSVVAQNEVITLTTDVTSGAIYYTLDGTMPTTASASGRTVTITGEPGTKVTLKAAAISSGGNQITSAATYSYTIMSRLKSVKSTVPTGAIFTEATYVTLSADSGNIYYTINGVEPTGTSTMYQNPILVDRPMTIRAVAIANGSSNSEVSTFSYGFADQVSQPVCSHTSGEVEIGTQISFTCDTENALLYYTTNGVDPDTSQMDRLQLYTGPIEVTRAATYKVIAVKDRMQSSQILTVGFTVKEKVVIEQEQTGVSEVQETTSGRLKSRRTYDSTADGPEFTDIILRNVNYGASVSAENDTIPQTAVLQVERTSVTDSAKAMIKQRLSDVYEVVTSYDITLWNDSVQIQPDGQIEIGLPIPAEYENAVVYVAYVGDDGVVELPTVRRFGGVAYVKTDHLSVYSIVVPSIEEDSNTGLWIRIIAGAAIVILLILGRWLISRQRKRKQEDAAW